MDALFLFKRMTIKDFIFLQIGGKRKELELPG
jgi:hypothetical protein